MGTDKLKPPDLYTNYFLTASSLNKSKISIYVFTWKECRDVRTARTFNGQYFVILCPECVKNEVASCSVCSRGSRTSAFVNIPESGLTICHRHKFVQCKQCKKDSPHIDSRWIKSIRCDFECKYSGRY